MLQHLASDFGAIYCYIYCELLKSEKKNKETKKTRQKSIQLHSNVNDHSSQWEQLNLIKETTEIRISPFFMCLCLCWLTDFWRVLYSQVHVEFRERFSIHDKRNKFWKLIKGDTIIFLFISILKWFRDILRTANSSISHFWTSWNAVDKFFLVECTTQWKSVCCVQCVLFKVRHAYGKKRRKLIENNNWRRKSRWSFEHDEYYGFSFA